VGAASIKAVVIVGVNALLTSGKKTESIDATEITEMESKIKAVAFEPKKGSWDCNY
jgi:hypothetical protein